MKYMVMVLGQQADYEAMGGDVREGQPVWTETDLRAMFTFMGELNDELTRSGELVDAQGLTEPARARLVTAGPDGQPVVTRGSYGEDGEVIAGYWVLNCDSDERVTEIAARVTRCPVPKGAPQYPVVVRPIQDGAGG